MAKTEREFVREAVLRLKEAGYEEFEEGQIYQPGDKVYQSETLLVAKRPKENLAFVGDGINDAPVLSLSLIHISTTSGACRTLQTPCS